MINPRDIEGKSDEELKELLGEDFMDEVSNNKGEEDDD